MTHPRDVECSLGAETFISVASPSCKGPQAFERAAYGTMDTQQNTRYSDALIVSGVTLIQMCCLIAGWISR